MRVIVYEDRLRSPGFRLGVNSMNKLYRHPILTKIIKHSPCTMCSSIAPHAEPPEGGELNIALASLIEALCEEDNK